jgi:ACT domain-containing protein
MKKNRDKELILKQLKKIPIMMVACEKVGIARSTVYRWRDDDKKFAKALEEALIEGESLINDMSESQLLSMIKEKNWSAISFWLRHRNPKFRERVEVTAKFEKQEELNSEQEEIVREALRLASINPISINEGEQKSHETD